MLATSGNRALREIFEVGLGDEKRRLQAPPFFLFTKPDPGPFSGWSRRFEGVFVPGQPRMNAEDWLVAKWFETDGMSRYKIASFYSDPRKQQIDRYSLQKAHYERWAATSTAWSAGLHRVRLAADLYVSSFRKNKWLWADRTYSSTTSGMDGH